MRPGLDDSWAYALNVLPHTDFLFGRDVVYTYGPLGFLLEPLNVGSNLIAATAFRLSIHAILAACLLYFALRASSVLPMMLFVIGYLMALCAVIKLEFSYHLLVLQSLLVLLAFRSARFWGLATAAAGVLAASLLFMKFGIGLLALSIYVGAAVCCLLAKQQPAVKVALTVVGSYLVAFAVLAAIYLQSIPNLVAWITHTIDISDGFSTALSSDGSPTFLLFAILSAMVYALITLCFFRWKSDLRGALVAFVPAIFLAFKHGFVRADGHERNFFPFILGLISILFLLVASRRELLAAVIGFCLVLALSLPVGTYYREQWELPSFVDTLLGNGGLPNVIDTMDFRRAQRTLDLQSAANFRTNQLPEAWIHDIREHNWSVDVMPWELTYVFVNHLNWAPEPVLQTYCAYTPALDQWSAEHFDANKAPDVLIVEFSAIDQRNLLLDTPAVTRSILWNYEPYKQSLRDNLFLLKKRPQPLAKDLVALTQQEIRKGEWSKVPDSDHALFAHLELSLSAFGRFMKTLYCIPAVYVDVVYQSGRRQYYRFTPEVGKDGLLLNYLPSTRTEFSDLLHNRPIDKVAKLRLSGPGMKYYGPTVCVRWEQAREPRFPVQLSTTFAEPAGPLGLPDSTLLTSALPGHPGTLPGWAGGSPPGTTHPEHSDATLQTPPNGDSLVSQSLLQPEEHTPVGR